MNQNYAQTSAAFSFFRVIYCDVTKRQFWNVSKRSRPMRFQITFTVFIVNRFMIFLFSSRCTQSCRWLCGIFFEASEPAVLPQVFNYADCCLFILHLEYFFLWNLSLKLLQSQQNKTVPTRITVNFWTISTFSS